MKLQYLSCHGHVFTFVNIIEHIVQGIISMEVPFAEMIALVTLKPHALNYTASLMPL